MGRGELFCVGAFAVRFAENKGQNLIFSVYNEFGIMIINGYCSQVQKTANSNGKNIRGVK